MTLGLKTRLFIISLILLVSVGGATSLYLELELRHWLEEEAGNDLLRLAHTYAAAVDGDVAQRARADVFAKKTNTSVWFFDSNYVPQEPSIPVPGDLRKALLGLKSGQERLHLERRGSRSVVAIYAIVPVENQKERWWLVLGDGPTLIQQSLNRMRFMLVISGCIAILLSSILIFIAVRVLSGRLQSILTRARAAIEDQRPDQGYNEQELTVLHRNIDRLDLALEDMLKTLARERYRFEAVLEGIREAVFAVNKSGEIVLTNRAGRKLLPKHAQAIGTPIFELLPHPEIKEALSLASQGEATDLEFDIERKRTRHILGQVTPHLSEGGAVMVLHDVTKLRRLESMRRDFVANVSHELRTPVSVIRLNAEALRDGALKDEKNGPRFVDATLRHAERLSNLVSDLLDISRIESGQYENRSGWINLSEFLEGLVNDIAPLAQQRSVNLQLEIRDRLDVMVDAKALEQVVTNLVQNAVKYADRPDIEVTVQVERYKKEAVVRVLDQGPGIALKHHGRIFERFYRVDAGRSKHMGGTGLGLAIVKHLVGLMGGTVGVYSNKPRGAVFWFSFAEFRKNRQSKELN
jgi:two-component system phosphate regulon sensor histidine kinase PhoR